MMKYKGHYYYYYRNKFNNVTSKLIFTSSI